MKMILLIDKNGNRLCNDGYLRSHTGCGGTFSWSGKTYKTLGGAKRALKKYKKLNIACIPEGMRVDSSGHVIETIPIPDEPDFVRFKIHKLTDFIIDKV